MKLHITTRMMISGVTPESARRTTRSDEEVWRLSWLPDRELTRDQALAGMELDEMLSDLARVHDPALHAAAEIRAAALGLTVEQALILLATQILGRMNDERDEQSPRRRAGGPGFGRRVIEPPRVRG